VSKSTISTFKLFERFPDEEAARLYLEGLLWPDGVKCLCCPLNTGEQGAVLRPAGCPVSGQLNRLISGKLEVPLLPGPLQNCSICFGPRAPMPKSSRPFRVASGCGLAGLAPGRVRGQPPS